MEKNCLEGRLSGMKTFRTLDYKQNTVTTNTKPALVEGIDAK